MKLFNKKKKPSNNNKFLKNLKRAINENKNKKEYLLRFRTILNKADDLTFQGKGVEEFNKNLTEGLVGDESSVPLINPNEKVTDLNLLIQSIDEAKFKRGDYSVKQEKKLPVTRFQKFIFKIKNGWEITKEFGRVIKFWFIAEYKIVRKLAYALNKKRNEIKIRKAFDNNRINFVTLYGYERGMKNFYRLSTSINNSIDLHKRVEKIRR